MIHTEGALPERYGDVVGPGVHAMENHRAQGRDTRTHCKKMHGAHVTFQQRQIKALTGNDAPCDPLTNSKATQSAGRLACRILDQKLQVPGARRARNCKVGAFSRSRKLHKLPGAFEGLQNMLRRAEFDVHHIPSGRPAATQSEFVQRLQRRFPGLDLPAVRPRDLRRAGAGF